MKRLLCILVLICTFLCGCSHHRTPHTVNPTKAPAPTQEAIATDRPADTAVPVTAVPTANITEAPTPEPTEYAPVPNVIAEYPITDILYNYTEDRAWVYYYNPDRPEQDKTEIGMIDKNGYLLFSGLRGTSYVTDTIKYLGDGYFWAETTGGRGYASVVCDLNGKIIVDTRDVEDGNERLFLGYGDGTFIVVETYASFSTYEKHLLELNSNGDIQYDLPLDESEHSYMYDSYYPGNKKLTYLKDGVFVSFGDNYYGGLVYNRNLHLLFDIPGAFDSIYISPEGELLTDRFINITDIDFSSRDAFVDLAEKSAPSNYDYSIFPWENDFSYFIVSEGLIINARDYAYEYNGVYNFKGERIAEFPSEWKITKALPYESGYAFLELRGLDGKNYITALDQYGNPQFDPMKVDDIYAPAWHGYAEISINGEEKVVFHNGDVTSIETIDRMSDDYTLGKYPSVCCGMRTCLDTTFGYRHYFQSKTGKIVDTVYKITNYAEVFPLKPIG